MRTQNSSFHNPRIQAKKAASRTLGLETNISSVFSYTMSKISNLGAEVERLKGINDNLNQKLANGVRQKEILTAKNFGIEQDILKTKADNHKLLVMRDNAEEELLNLKREAHLIDNNWESKKKELQLEIYALNEAKVTSTEDKERGKLCLGQQKINLVKEIQGVKHRAEGTKLEIRKYQDKIAALNNKEMASLRSINAEKQLFRQFLNKAI